MMEPRRMIHSAKLLGSILLLLCIVTFLRRPDDARLLAAPDKMGQTAASEPIPDSTPPSRSQQSPSAAQQTYSGRLVVVWGDSKPGSDQTVIIYTLVTDDGTQFNILPGLVTAGELLSFDGRYVTVSGNSAERQSVPTAQPLPLRVHSIQGHESKDVAGRERQLSGSQPWVSILCKFADSGVEKRPLSYFQNMYGSTYPALDHYWRELSYNQINLNGSAAYGWFTLPYPRAYYVYDMDGDGQLDADLMTLAKDCTAVADAVCLLSSLRRN